MPVPGGSFDWTDSEIAYLGRLFADGLSASAIASRMGGGLTRNAIIGKVGRLGLTRESHPTSSPAKRRPAQRPVRTEKFKPSIRPAELPTPRSQPTTEADDSAIPVEQRRTLDQLEARHCRWPCGRPGTPDFFFCGSPTADFPSVPYCPAHAARAYAGKGRAPPPWVSWGGPKKARPRA